MPDPTTINVPRRPASAPGAGAPSPGISLTRDDIYFILFRHKWLIAIFATVGIVASVLFYLLQPPIYRSEAKLLVRYVFDAKGNEGVGTDGQIKSAETTGENIMSSEIEILTSLDLCEQVGGTLGPDKVLRRPATTNESLAAGLILRKGLSAEVVRKSSVIQVSMIHRDQEVAVRGLTMLVDAYLRRHVEVHRAIGVDTLLSQQTDQFRTRLMETERKLRSLKTNFVGVSIEDARKTLTEQLAKIRQDIFLAEADLASSFATTGIKPFAWGNTNVAPLTNATATAPSTNNDAVTNLAADVSPAAISEYRSLCARVDGLRSHELDLLGHFKEENSLVKNVRQQILETEVRKQLLEGDYPSLLRIDTSVKATGAPAALPSFDTDRLRIAGIQARYIALTNQLTQVRGELALLDSIEGEVHQLQRAKELEEKNYRYYAAGLEQKKFDDALVGGKLENISIIQAPTPPGRENTKRSKMALGLLAGGILGGLAVAFLIEMLLDRSLKLPAHVEDRLHLPLFASIPRLLGKAESRKLKAETGRTRVGQGSRPAPALPASSESRTGVPPVPGGIDFPVAITDPEKLPVSTGQDGLSSLIRPYIETLRDRVLFYFEGNTRKPKLVGVTGCGHGSGVTTMAAGLAASLSETGGGNVLLVDLNLEHNTAHPFFKGQPGCGLADAVENDRRESGLVSENLYLAMGRNGVENGSESLPLRLSQIVPKLRVSDYDYIVFDLPRVTQTGLTSRLSGMMDLVLLVVESGKDQKDVLDRSLALMNASGAKLGGVLNKVQSYVPRRFRSHFYEPAA